MLLKLGVVFGSGGLKGQNRKRIEEKQKKRIEIRIEKGNGTEEIHMILFPAIDLYEKKAVRLLKGDYANMTIYSHRPLEIARDFERCGATHIHMVDLEGAKEGTTPNLSVVEEIAGQTSLFVEAGGGVRSMETVDRYFSAGVSRVILGTAAVKDEALLREAAGRYGERIAVGADVKNGRIAIKGWLEESAVTLDEFLERMQGMGIRNVICTDISRDGAMQGANLKLYRELSLRYAMDITASGGVSSLEDVAALSKIGLYGAIIGKAYYTGAIDLRKAVEAVSREESMGEKQNLCGKGTRDDNEENHSLS